MPVHALVTAPTPGNHRFRVTITLAARHASLVFPSWAPGSYLMREFARNVRDIHARTADGAPVAVERTSRNTWELGVAGLSPDAEIVLTYEVYAREKSVRTPFLDADLAFFLPSNLLVHPATDTSPGFVLEVEVPEGHVGVCPLGEAVRGPARARWTCEDVDTLHDSFVAVAPFEHTSFTVHGVVHHHWIEPGHDGDLARMNADLATIVATAAKLFGGTLPYPRYDFVTLLMAKGHGGLEHKDGCVLLRPRTSLSAPKDYEEFLTLAAHEHFHAWNVKRIHPDSLGPRFDYANEHYTRDLWWLEGGTVFYEERIAYRAGLVDEARHLERLAELAQRVLDSRGAHHQSLEDSSFDAWIKLYRPGEDSGNSTLSYYIKGAVVCWAMDLELLRRSEGRVGVDSLLAALWERWGRHGVGFPERDALRALAIDLAGGDPEFARWFDAHVRGTEPVHLAAALDHAGIDLVRAAPRQGASLGVELDERGLVTSVREDAPASALLTPGDELLAVNHLRTAGASAVAERLRATTPGASLEVLLTRDGVVRSVSVPTLAPPPGAVSLRLRPTADEARLQVRAAFLARG